MTGLPKSASWQDLKDHFRRVGEVTFTQARLSRFLAAGGCRFSPASWQDVKGHCQCAGKLAFAQVKCPVD